MASPEWLSRASLLVGDQGIEKLANSHVLIVGLGGVGSFAAEAIARAGVGRLTVIDGDRVEASNRNRQLPALISTNGQSPTTAKRLRQFFEDVIPEDVDDLVQNLNEFRKTIKGDFEQKVQTLNEFTKGLISKKQTK